MAQHEGQAVMSCQMCEQTTQIKMKCLDCDYLLCAICCQLHKKVKELRDHQLVDIHNYATIKEGGVAKINFRNIECRSHAEQKCCLFCKDCDKVVCVICISEKHYQHKMIEMSEGRKLHIEKIATWRTDLKRKIKTLTADMSTLNTKYSTENFKYNIEKEKIHVQDKALKQAVDTQTKTHVHDLDQRWYRIDKSVKDEISHTDKYKQRLQSREEELKQALESSNAGDFFRTVEEEKKKKRPDLDGRPVNLKYETLPTFITREINIPVIHSLHGSLLDNTCNTKADVKNIKIHAVECYKTESPDLSSIQCNTDGTVWINNWNEEILHCVEKHKNGTLTTKKIIQRDIHSIALTLRGDLLLSVGKSFLQVIPHTQQTITNSQYSVSPLVTTTALHVSSDKIIVGAKEIGPKYPANGPRQIVVMDTNGKYEKVYQFDSNNRPLFTNPRRVTADSMNNLYVLDRKSDDWAGRVIIINNSTGKIIVYNGHPKVNNQDHPLTPGDIVATKSDNIVVSDRGNNLLHILNCDGECVKYINTEEHGIKWPWSLDIDKRDLLHIGCYKKGFLRINAGLMSGSELYVVKFTGF